MSSITIKNREAKTYTFTYTRNGSALDLSAATMAFAVKDQYDDTTYLIEKVDGDFDKSQASVGVVSVTLETTDTIETNITAGTYLSEIRATITGTTDVDISANIEFTVEKSVFHG